ncbi:hypothetical protein [Pararhodobacter sp. SW119]|uniref:hypothetical protein n=1 Tax=Pararhodobacter sp. SW119 TaxID=2780075 RepID=UPI001ADED295|nr:hypothetical protein [Pararhodobacter sp. SW119]
MTAPDTNTKKQARRHRGPLIGIILAVLVAGALMFWFLGRTMVVEPEVQDEPPAAAIDAEPEQPADAAVADPDDPAVDDDLFIDEPAPPSD